MRQETWIDVALKVWGGLALAGGFIMWLFNRGRKQANVTISKTENEVYKTIIENKLAEVNITEIIEKKVEMEIKKFKDMLWDAQEEHYKVKLDMQERLLQKEKEKNEILREKTLIANEHAECQEQIDGLRDEVAKLKKQINKS